MPESEKRKINVQIIVGESSEKVSTPGIADSKMNIVNPSLVFGIPAVPTTMSFAATILTSGIDLSKEHVVSFKVIGIKGETLSEINGQLHALARPISAGYNFSINFRNIIFEKEGDYKIEFRLDNATDPTASQSFTILL
ncbi:hypothetical protein ATX11_05950 [Oenococcus oeni]|uniref:DUF6941 family protein n=1 Tax=Oenococcus oeni TaxID=1247 RepID=UPI0008F87B2F|nr:hypothetical protein [Oenococcus oeni]OIL37868.1 hypothetical protein ATX11_05950 [Oenococcus oeni]